MARPLPTCSSRQSAVGAAQYRLGLLRAVGLGVQASVAESYKWLSLAAAAEDEDKSALLAGVLRAKLAARIVSRRGRGGAGGSRDIQASCWCRGAADEQAGPCGWRDDSGGFASPAAARRLRAPGGRGRRSRQICDCRLPSPRTNGQPAGARGQGSVRRHAVELRVTEVEPNLCAALDVIARTPSVSGSTSVVSCAAPPARRRGPLPIQRSPGDRDSATRRGPFHRRRLFPA